MTRQQQSDPLPYETPKEPVGRHGSLVYLRDDEGGLIVTGPHSDALELWPRVKRGLAVTLGVGMFMATIGAAFGGLMIDLRPGSFGVRGNVMARIGVYAAVPAAVALLIVWFYARAKRTSVTIEANREGVTYRVQRHDGQERIERWTAGNIFAVGAGADHGLVLVPRDGPMVRLYLGRRYAEWMKLAEEVNQSLGRPMAELAPLPREKGV